MASQTFVGRPQEFEVWGDQYRFATPLERRSTSRPARSVYDIMRSEIGAVPGSVVVQRGTRQKRFLKQMFLDKVPRQYTSIIVRQHDWFSYNTL